MFDPGPRVVVIGAHPDDAEIAVGGTIARWAKAGADVTILTMTSSGMTPQETADRMQAATLAAEGLGARLLFLCDGALVQVTDLHPARLVAELDEKLAALEPTTILSHCLQDSHQDHIAVARSVLSSSRRLRAALLQFGPAEHRVAGGGVFEPNLWVDISAVMPLKLEAIRRHSLDSASYRPIDTRHIELVNRLAGSRFGVEYAEELKIVREII